MKPGVKHVKQVYGFVDPVFLALAPGGGCHSAGHCGTWPGVVGPTVLPSVPGRKAFIFFSSRCWGCDSDLFVLFVAFEGVFVEFLALLSHPEIQTADIPFMTNMQNDTYLLMLPCYHSYTYPQHPRHANP